MAAGGAVNRRRRRRRRELEERGQEYGSDIWINILSESQSRVWLGCGEEFDIWIIYQRWMWLGGAVEEGSIIVEGKVPPPTRPSHSDSASNQDKQMLRQWNKAGGPSERQRHAGKTPQREYGSAASSLQEASLETVESWERTRCHSNKGMLP